MKYLICSDIHGAIDSTEFLINKFHFLNCDKFICLGDVLYHGPRNDLPKEYAPKKVIQALNSIKEDILCIQGNCDAEVDQMVLDFPLRKELDMKINDKNVHLEHGHHLLDKVYDTDMVLFGHTHIPLLEEKDSVIFINPGSITIPKGESKRGYIVWDNHTITGYTIDDTIVFQYDYE